MVWKFDGLFSITMLWEISCLASSAIDDYIDRFVKDANQDGPKLSGKVVVNRSINSMVSGYP
jgi:hypothetical protein